MMLRPSPRSAVSSFNFQLGSMFVCWVMVGIALSDSNLHWGDINICTGAT